MGNVFRADRDCRLIFITRSSGVAIIDDFLSDIDIILNDENIIFLGRFWQNTINIIEISTLKM